MRLKAFFLFLLIIVSLTFFSHAEKRKPPILLEELQNPSGPSYVPIPFPKTREEIIVDLKHAIKILYAPQRGQKTVGEDPGSKILPGLLEENSGYVVGNIVKAANKSLYRAAEFFVIEIFDYSRTVVARVSLEDSGLFAGAGFSTERYKIKPLKSFKEAGTLLKSKSIGDDKIVSINYEYLKAKGCRPTYPFLKIKTLAKTFYINSKDVVYEVKNIERKQVSSPLHYPKLNNEYQLAAYDQINEEIIYLTKVE